MDKDQKDTLDEFRRVVNMAPKALESWLDTDESKSVGITHGDSNESVGHRSGRRIVELLKTKQADLSDSDIAHMNKVVGYVHRHSKQRPDGDIEHTPWRYSLMNWGHDPMA